MVEKLEPRIKRAFIFANESEDIEFISRRLKEFEMELYLMGTNMGMGVGEFIHQYEPFSTDLIISTADFGLFGDDLDLLKKYINLMNLNFYCEENRGNLEWPSCFSTGLRFGCALYRFMKKRNFPMDNFIFLLDEQASDENGKIVVNSNRIILDHNPKAKSLSRLEFENGGLKEILY